MPLPEGAWPTFSLNGWYSSVESAHLYHQTPLQAMGYGLASKLVLKPSA